MRTPAPVPAFLYFRVGERTPLAAIEAAVAHLRESTEDSADGSVSCWWHLPGTDYIATWSPALRENISERIRHCGDQLVIPGPVDAFYPLLTLNELRTALRETERNAHHTGLFDSLGEAPGAWGCTVPDLFRPEALAAYAGSTPLLLVAEDQVLRDTLTSPNASRVTGLTNRRAASASTATHPVLALYSLAESSVASLARLALLSPNSSSGAAPTSHAAATVRAYTREVRRAAAKSAKAPPMSPKADGLLLQLPLETESSVRADLTSLLEALGKLRERRRIRFAPASKWSTELQRANDQQPPPSAPHKGKPPTDRSEAPHAPPPEQALTKPDLRISPSLVVRNELSADEEGLQRLREAEIELPSDSRKHSPAPSQPDRVRLLHVSDHAVAGAGAATVARVGPGAREVLASMHGSARLEDERIGLAFDGGIVSALTDGRVRFSRSSAPPPYITVNEDRLKWPAQSAFSFEGDDGRGLMVHHHVSLPFAKGLAQVETDYFFADEDPCLTITFTVTFPECTPGHSVSKVTPLHIPLLRLTDGHAGGSPRISTRYRDGTGGSLTHPLDRDLCLFGDEFTFEFPTVTVGFAFIDDPRPPARPLHIHPFVAPDGTNERVLLLSVGQLTGPFDSSALSKYVFSSAFRLGIDSDHELRSPPEAARRIGRRR